MNSDDAMDRQKSKSPIHITKSYPTSLCLSLNPIKQITVPSMLIEYTGRVVFGSGCRRNANECKYDWHTFHTCTCTNACDCMSTIF